MKHRNDGARDVRTTRRHQRRQRDVIDGRRGRHEFDAQRRRHVFERRLSDAHPPFRHRHVDTLCPVGRRQHHGLHDVGGLEATQDPDLDNNPPFDHLRSHRHVPGHSQRGKIDHSVDENVLICILKRASLLAG